MLNGAINGVQSLGQLQTEASSPLARTIGSLDTQALCAAFNSEEARVSPAVAQCVPTIAALIDDLVPRLKAGGRLIYVGAGNSGRVGFMDCSELPVTFSAQPEQFLTVVAGGAEAIIRAREGAEDFEQDGIAELEAMQLTADDTVIGISASGRTPFVLGALRVALKKGNVLTAGITNVHPSAIGRLGVKHCISALVGPEFLAGSTRLKAGSAAKQILNMISTCSMVRLGKTYKGLMVDVRVKNHKLKARGRRIVRQVCEGSAMYVVDEKGIPSPDAIRMPEDKDGDAKLDVLIEKCGGSVKLACAVAISGLSPAAAKDHLDSVDGHLSLFVDKISAVPTKNRIPIGNTSDQEYFLSIDGGGTNCKVSIATKTGIVARASSGACNVNSVSIDELMENIRLATARAVELIPDRILQTDNPLRFTKVWAGLSGLYFAYDRETVASGLEKLFNASVEAGSLILSSDDALLKSYISIDDNVDGGISVIAGTGAVATAFKKSTATGEVVRVGRTGGWGCLLGDQGSAFDIGKRAVQAMLAGIEERQGEGSTASRQNQCTPLEAEILSRLNCSQAELLPYLLHGGTTGEQPKNRIASLATVVTQLGFREEGQGPDVRALAILKDAARALAKTIKPLTTKQICEPSSSVLVLAGGLMKLPQYRALVLEECSAEGIMPFKKIVVVDDASGPAAQLLASSTRKRKRNYGPEDV